MTPDAEWKPDGRGLPEEMLGVVKNLSALVHLRLSPPDDRYPRIACEEALGAIWSGDLDEVTCPSCVQAAERQGFVRPCDIEECCPSCRGRGSDHSGPCSDCYGTGNAHG